VFGCVWMCLDVFGCVCMCLYVFFCVCLCLYVYVCVCMCMCMYVYLSIFFCLKKEKGLASFVCQGTNGEDIIIKGPYVCEGRPSSAKIYAAPHNSVVSHAANPIHQWGKSCILNVFLSFL
jgi:hypothetical protein